MVEKTKKNLKEKILEYLNAYKEFLAQVISETCSLQIIEKHCQNLIRLHDFITEI